MPTFRVTWEIDVERDTPLEAAREAQVIMRDPASTATFFTVTDLHGCTITLNLAELPQE